MSLFPRLLALSVLSAAFLTSSPALAQCGLTVDAGPDRAGCPGADLQLTGSVTGANVTSVSWSPVTGLDDPTSLTPTVTVDGDATYVLTAQVFDPTANLITDGTFENFLLASSVSTDYIRGLFGPFGPLSAEGTFGLAATGNDLHSNFSSCPEHTGNGGRMMVVNGSDNANTNVWCETVAVTAGTDYVFRAFALSMVSENPAELQFSINGVLLGSTVPVETSGCNWIEVTESWNSGGATSAEICIVNQNTEPSGNDFAIDDLFFGEVCEQTDAVTVTEVPVEATVAAADPLRCEPETVTLDGTGSSTGPGYTYAWSGPAGATILNGTTLTPEVNLPGLYTLTVTYTYVDVSGATLNCTTEGFTFVIDETNRPFAGISVTGQLDCNTDVITLTATGDGGIASPEYLWTNADGDPVGNPGDRSVFVDAAGVYTLLLRNLDSGCEDQVSVTVEDQTTPPVWDVAPFAPFTCNRDVVTIDATNTRVGPNFLAQWSTPDGTILSGAFSLTPTFGSPGTYTAVLQDFDTGCSSDTTLTLDFFRPALDVVIADPPALSCTDASVQLFSTGSSTDPGYDYTWVATDGGNLVDLPTEPNPRVDAPGTYTLTISDPVTGCENSASVTVTGGGELPTIAINAPDLFTCVRAQIMLDASGTDQGAGLTYAWSPGPGGSVVSGGTTLNPVVSGAATYTLTVTNAATGCTDSRSVTVGEDLTPPLADAGADFVFTCAAASATLDGTASEQGAGYTYAWTTPDGNLSAGSAGLTPTVTTSGTYVLTVRRPDNGCTATDTVRVSPDDSAPFVTVAPPDTLDCQFSFVDLDASGSDDTGGNTLAWTTTDGNFLADSTTLTPRVDRPGTYVLTLTNAGGCASSQAVTVVLDTVRPVADAGPAATVNCTDPAVTLAGSADVPDAEFAWLRPGNPSFPQDFGPTLEATTAGVYTLLAVNPRNRCAGVATVAVSVDTLRPAVPLSPSAPRLNCRNTSVTLNFGQTAQPDLTYAWTTADGTLGSSATDVRQIATAGGTYVLTVGNPDNGCSAADSVTVAVDTLRPTVAVAGDLTLTCATPELTVVPTVTNGGLVQNFRWTDAAGDPLPGQDDADFTTSVAGDYFVEVTATNNGCTTTVPFTVGADFAPPVAEAGAPVTLTCVAQEQRLDGSGTPATGLSYGWTTPDGTLVADADTPQPLVSAPGRYYLTVTRSDNGCTDVDSVSVGGNLDRPAVDLTASGLTLTCTTPAVTLSTTTAAGQTYDWFRDGAAAPFTSGPTVDVTTAGAYRLRVTRDADLCSRDTVLTIGVDTVSPVALLAVGANLTCATPTVDLDATGSATGGNLTYAWTGPTGAVLSTAPASSLNVSEAGAYRLTIRDSANGCARTAGATVAVDTLRPTAVIAAPALLTCRDSSQLLNATASDDGADFAWVWSTEGGSFVGDVTDLMPRIDGAGVYRLTVRNLTNGCRNEAAVTVLADQTPPGADAGAAQSTLNCAVTQIELGANPDAGGLRTYAWSATPDGTTTLGTDPTLSVSAPGDYYLTVTNPDNGCVSTDRASVDQDTVRPAVVVTERGDLNCTDQSVRLAVAPPAPGPTYATAWTDLVTGQAVGTDYGITVTAGGDYRFVVINTDNRCRDSVTVTVAQDTVRPVAAVAAPDRLDCATTALALDGTASSAGPDFAYAWTTVDGTLAGGATTAVADVTSGGTYLLRVTDLTNGCSNGATAVVSQDTLRPAASLSPAADLTCRTASVVLTAAAEPTLVFAWTTPDGSIVAGADTATPEVDAPGSYLLTVTDPDNSCTRTLDLTVARDTVSPVLDLGSGFDLGCDDKPVRLEARVEGGGPFSYAWTSAAGTVLDNGATARPIVQGGGFYVARVTDQTNGCVSVDSVEVIQNILLGFTTDVRGLTCRLPRGRIAITAVDGGTEPFLYSYDGGTTFVPAAAADSLAAGPYAVAIQDANGCELAATVDVPPAPQLELALDAPRVIELGDSVRLNLVTNADGGALAQIVWSPAEQLSCQGCPRPVAAPSRVTTFTVAVTDTLGCSALDSITVIVDVQRTVYFPTGFSPNGDGVNDVYYPFANPERVARVRSFAIFDRWGNQVHEAVDFSPNDAGMGWDGTLNGRTLNPAVFVFTAEVEFVDGVSRSFRGSLNLLR